MNIYIYIYKYLYIHIYLYMYIYIYCSRGWQPRQARAVPAPVARGRNGPQDHCRMPVRG